MKASDEWWDSDASEEQNNLNVNLTKPPKHFVEENNQDTITLNSRSKEIVYSSAMFLIGLFLAWDYWVFPFTSDYEMGFNIILLSGLGLNQNTASKISEKIYGM